MRSILCSIFASAGVACAAGVATNGLNAATVYAPVFSNITGWAQAHPDFSFKATNVSSPEAEAAFKELQPQVVALEGADTATHLDWGTKFDDGFAALLPYVTPAMKAMRAANWASAYAASNNLPGADRYALDATRVARDVGEDRLLIDLLVQIAGEIPAMEQLARSAEHMSAAELDQLDRKLAALPEGASTVEAMQMEKAMFVNSLINKLRKAMESADTNLFEIVAAESGGTNAAGDHAITTTNTAAKSWLADHLRLAAIVDAGTGIKIGFDSDEMGSFMISFGRPKFGIDLLSVDFNREEAVIARGTETALVKLKGRQIVPFKLRLKIPKPGEASLSSAEQLKNPLAAIIAGMQFSGDTPHSAKEYEEFIRELGSGSAEDFLKYLQRVASDYDELIAAFKSKPLAEFRPWSEDYLKKATMLTRVIFPAVEKVAEKEQKLTGARNNLAAAIAARRAELAKQ
jgi:hypothetical protein